MTLKIEVLAPIARAMVTTTVIVNIGLLRSVRNAQEKSFNMAASVDSVMNFSQAKIVRKSSEIQHLFYEVIKGEDHTPMPDLVLVYLLAAEGPMAACTCHK